MRRLVTSLLLRSFAALLLAACAVTPPPLYDGLGDSGHALRSESELAAAYFDQGLALCWGFNHDEARRSFEHVARLDPSSPMAHWGTAYALGPNINAPLSDPAVATRAHRAAQHALAMVRAEERAEQTAREASRLSATAAPAGAPGASQDSVAADAPRPRPRTTPLERALVEALAVRFADPPPADRTALDRAYADAMRAVWRRFPQEPLAGVLFADALMNIDQTWRNWGSDAERGEHTLEIVATLERVLAEHPSHAGANHFYIHAVEASPRPERAMAAARQLGALMPAAGHMVHMPAHIYMRLGMYDASVEANARAVAADDAFFAQAERASVYHLYRAHNHHFLVWAAMFRGARDTALHSARELEAKLPDAPAQYAMLIDAYRFVPLHVLMRFGEWSALLAEPAPGARHPLSTALWHHARAVAAANTARFELAREEAAAFAAAAAGVRAGLADAPGMEEFAGEIAKLLDIADHVLWGEILFREGDHAAGLERLRAGVAVEDALHYAEPPGWMQPVRHALGALLLEDGRVEEAEAVYRADLERYADNVWSLHGLAESLRRQGREADALWVQRRFDEVAAGAEVPITASCLCRKRDA